MATFGCICAMFFMFFSIFMSIHCGLFEEEFKGWFAVILLVMSFIWIITIAHYIPKKTTVHSVITATEIVYENDIPVDTIKYYEVKYGN